MSGKRRGLLAPQNNFLENVAKRCQEQSPCFLIANARFVEYPVVFISDEFYMLTGYTRAEMMLKPATLAHLHGELTDPQAVGKLSQIFENQGHEKFELLIYKKNKHPMWLHYEISPIFNDLNEVVLILCLFKDVTSVKVPLDDEDSRAMGRFVKLARTVNRSKLTQQGLGPSIGRNRVTAGDAPPPDTQLTVSSEAPTLPRYELLSPYIPKLILLHSGTFRQAWDWGLFLLTLYTALIAPFMITYRFNKVLMENTALAILDSLVDLTFCIDIGMNFRTTYADHSGEIITDSRLISRKYLRTWLLIDVISSIPFEIIQQIWNSVPTAELHSQTISAVRIIKVIRVLRCFRIIRRIDDYMEYIGGQLIVFLCIYLIIAHWFSLIWVAIGYSEVATRDDNWLNYVRNRSYITQQMKFNETNVTTEEVQVTYVSALYFTLSVMTTVGFGNIAAETTFEKAFVCVLMFFGALMYAVIFGSITTMYQEFQANNNRYHDMLTSIRDFIKFHQVERELGERVLDYFISSWTMSKGVDTDKVMNYCPKDMRADLGVHLFRHVLKEHPAFRLASEGCLRALAINFELRHSAPSDLLSHTGESIENLCFVISGSLEVIQDDEVVAILTRGDCYGDYFWKERSVGQACVNVRALTYSDLHVIHRDDLLNVLQFYTAFAHSFNRNMILTYNLRNRTRLKKLKDYRREQAEKAKQRIEPANNIPLDHPVRKMINRFKQLPSPDQDETNRSAPEGDENPSEILVQSSSEGDRQTDSRQSKGAAAENSLVFSPSITKPSKTVKRPWIKTDKNNVVATSLERSPSINKSNGTARSTPDETGTNALMKLRNELKNDIHSLAVKMEMLDTQMMAVIQGGQSTATLKDSNSPRISDEPDTISNEIYSPNVIEAITPLVSNSSISQ